VSIAALPSTVMDLVGAGDSRLFPLPPLSRHWNASRDHADRGHVVAELARFRNQHEERPSTHGAIRSLVSGQWHYIVHEKFGCALFDVTRDPKELEDLAGRPGFGEVVQQLSGQLAASVAEFRGEGQFGPPCLGTP